MPYYAPLLCARLKRASSRRVKFVIHKHSHRMLQCENCPVPWIGATEKNNGEALTALCKDIRPDNGLMLENTAREIDISYLLNA